jgi:hypothetical protein
MLRIEEHLINQVLASQKKNDLLKEEILFLAREIEILKLFAGTDFDCYHSCSDYYSKDPCPRCKFWEHNGGACGHQCPVCCGCLEEKR